MNKPIAILTSPRSGSMWVYHYISAHNKKYFNMKCFQDFAGYSEPWLPQKSKEERQRNMEYILSNDKMSFKCMYGQIKREGLEMFIDEYLKDFHVIILKRRDYVRSAISWAMMKKGFFKGYNSTGEVNVKSIHVDTSYVKNVLTAYNDLEHFRHDEIWYYEDLTDEFLLHYTGLTEKEVKVNTVNTSIHNYERYVHNIDELRNFTLDKKI